MTRIGYFSLTLDGYFNPTLIQIEEKTQPGHLRPLIESGVVPSEILYKLYHHHLIAKAEKMYQGKLISDKVMDTVREKLLTEEILKPLSYAFTVDTALYLYSRNEISQDILQGVKDGSVDPMFIRIIRRHYRYMTHQEEQQDKHSIHALDKEGNPVNDLGEQLEDSSHTYDFDMNSFFARELLAEAMECTNHYLQHTNCTNDTYSLPVLEDYVFYELRAIFKQILLEKAQQEDSVRQAKRQLKDCQRQILTLKRQLESAIQDKRKLFEAFFSREITQTDFSSRKEALTLFSNEIQAKIADQEKVEAALSSVTVNPEILVLAEKAEHYLSEGALTRDMVTDYVKEVKIYGADDYRITWKYPELFEEMRVKANWMVVGLHHNPTR